MVLGQGSDGGVNIKCPWSGEHSSETSDSATTYWPPTSGKKPGFKCLHGHCDGRGIRDLHVWLRAMDPTFNPRPPDQQRTGVDHAPLPTGEAEPEGGEAKSNGAAIENAADVENAAKPPNPNGNDEADADQCGDGGEAWPKQADILIALAEPARTVPYAGRDLLRRPRRSTVTARLGRSVVKLSDVGCCGASSRRPEARQTPKPCNRR